MIAQLATQFLRPWTLRALKALDILSLLKSEEQTAGRTDVLTYVLTSSFTCFFFISDEYYATPSEGTTTTTHRSVSRPDIKSNVEQKPLSKKNRKIEDCQIFILIGSILGCLLIAASLMMCILSARLMKLTKKYKREKLEGVVREHRMKFGNPSSATAAGPEAARPTSDLFSTSGNSNFLSQR